VPNLEVILAGAREHLKLQPLYTNGGTSTLASLHPRQDSLARGSKFTTADIQIVTLDSIIAGKQLKHVDFLKSELSHSSLAWKT
jgi:hypothetical protein